MDSAHADKLLAYPYMEKYGDNRIRKVSKGYFCEFCSLLLATSTKVSLHVQEKSHYEKKGTFLLCRPSGLAAVLAFDDLLIGEKAWHSLSEDTCAICNEEFDNENIHKTESAHLLKLVQNKVEFGADNGVYRKTDDNSFQCLTCNAVFALSILNTHFTDAEHKTLYAKCQEEYKKYIKRNKNKPSEKIKEVTDTKNEIKDTKNDINDTKIEVKDTNIEVKDTKIDVKDTKVEVKDTKNDVKDTNNDVKDNNLVDKNHNEIHDSIAKEVKSCNELVPKVETKTEPEDESTIFAKGNNLTYNTGNTNAFCRICETKLPATLRSMKEHVNGKEHKNRLGRLNHMTRAKETGHITRKSMEKFIRQCEVYENIFYQIVIVNDKYCISFPSYSLMVKVGTRYRCQTCEVTVSEDDIVQHVKGLRHERALGATSVITSLPDTEFVREVRPGIFHCGYCNQIVPRWEDVACHLQSREHKDNKDLSAWRLQRHLPALMQHRRRQELANINILHMLAMMEHSMFR